MIRFSRLHRTLDSVAVGPALSQPVITVGAGVLVPREAWDTMVVAPPAAACAMSSVHCCPLLAGMLTIEAISCLPSGLTANEKNAEPVSLKVATCLVAPPGS